MIQSTTAAGYGRNSETTADTTIYDEFGYFIIDEPLETITLIEQENDQIPDAPRNGAVSNRIKFNEQYKTPPYKENIKYNRRMMKCDRMEVSFFND